MIKQQELRKLKEKMINEQNNDFYNVLNDNDILYDDEDICFDAYDNGVVSNSGIDNEYSVSDKEEITFTKMKQKRIHKARSSQQRGGSNMDSWVSRHRFCF